MILVILVNILHNIVVDSSTVIQEEALAVDWEVLCAGDVDDVS